MKTQKVCLSSNPYTSKPSGITIRTRSAKRRGYKVWPIPTLHEECRTRSSDSPILLSPNPLISSLATPSTPTGAEFVTCSTGPKIRKWQFTDRNDLMTDPDWLRGYRALADHDGSFDLQVWPWQLADAADLAHRVPEVPIVLDHTGMPRDWDEAGVKVWRNGMKALANTDNVSVKISALGMFAGEFTAERIRQFVLDTIEIFGVDRCMFASNYPVDMLFSSYAAIWDAYDEITSDFSDAERDKIFKSNAERYYRI